MHKTMAKVTSYAVIVWTVAAFFVLAFRCGASRPWAPASGQCIDEVSPSQSVLGTSTHLLEVSILAWHCTIRYTHRAIHDRAPNPYDATSTSRSLEEGSYCDRIHLPGTVRFPLFPDKSILLTNVRVIAATILRLVCLHTAYSSSDFIFFSVNSAITTQCVLSLSVFTACIPCLKPFLDGFDSGMLGVGLHRRTPAGSKANTYELGNFRNTKDSVMHSRIGSGEVKGMGYSAAIVAGDSEGSRSRREDSGSVSSTKSDQMIIKRTDQWHVQYEQVIPNPTPRTDEEESVIEPRKAVHSTF